MKSRSLLVQFQESKAMQKLNIKKSKKTPDLDIHISAFSTFLRTMRCWNCKEKDPKPQLESGAILNACHSGSVLLSWQAKWSGRVLYKSFWIVQSSTRYPSLFPWPICLFDHWFNCLMLRTAMGFTGFTYDSYHQIRFGRPQKCLPQTNFPTLRRCHLCQPWRNVSRLLGSMHAACARQFVKFQSYGYRFERKSNKGMHWMHPSGCTFITSRLGILQTQFLGNFWSLVFFLGTIPYVYFLIF